MVRIFLYRDIGVKIFNNGTEEPPQRVGSQNTCGISATTWHIYVVERSPRWARTMGRRRGGIIVPWAHTTQDTPGGKPEAYGNMRPKGAAEKAIIAINNAPPTRLCARPLNNRSVLILHSSSSSSPPSPVAYPSHKRICSLQTHFSNSCQDK